MSEHSVRDCNRFDFQVELVDVDPETGKVEYHVHPDPGRYEWQDHDGERALYDRFDEVFFSHALVIDMLKRAVAMEPGPALGVIPEVDEYVLLRRPAIAASLRGESADGELVDLAEERLRELEKDELAFAIMSVDVVGSTKLKESIEPKRYAAMITTVQTEIAELVALFHGHVLKYTGDGLIGYFAGPTFIIKNDTAADCGLCVHRLLYEAINPELEAAGLPRLEIRIGIDSGEATVVLVGSAKTKRHADLIGITVDLACKIEKSASSGEILVGESVHRNLHFTWRELCSPSELPARWTYSISGGEPYLLFRLDHTGTRPVERQRQGHGATPTA